MSDKSALRPTIFNIDAFKEPDITAKVISEDETALAALDGNHGWHLVVEFKQRVIREMEEANKALMASGQSFDEIGKNAVVINLAENVVDRIINLVGDAREVIDSNGK